MKKIIAISFLFIFVCANTEIGQLLKFSNLIHHYLEHRNNKGDQRITFIDFVKSHYNDNHKHSDNNKLDEHKNLPFKTINSSVNTMMVCDYQLMLSFTKSNTISANIIIPFIKEFYTSDVVACIWLPPKLS